MGSLYELVDWKSLISEALETECRGITTYTKRYAACEQAILSNCLSATTNWEKSLLISYLELNTLCNDNSFTSAAVTWSSNSLRIQLENVITQLSDAITTAMTPTFIPMTSTWLRRRRQDHEALMARQDFATFYKWNIVIIHHVREIIDYGYSTVSPREKIDPSVYGRMVYGLEQLAVTAKKALDSAAEATLMSYMSKLFQTKMEGSFTKTQDGLIKAYMLFQELHSELKASGIIRGDPYLGNKFDTFELHFEVAYKSNFNAPAQRLFQDAAMRVYTEWRKSPLLYSRYGNQQPVAILTKVERILCRIDRMLKSMRAEAGELVAPLIADTASCLESVRVSTDTIQYAADDAEMNVLLLKDIAKSFVRN